MNKNKTYFLEDLLTLKYGKDQKKVIDPLGQFPILGTGGIIGYSNTFLYDKPSVLIGRKGTIDKVSFIDVPFWTIDTLFYSEINEELTIPKWLYYRLSLIDFSRYNEATGVPSLKTTTLNKIPITICSLQEQQKIASVLSALDDQIELNNKINQELEDFAQTLYNYWFVQFEFPNEEGKPYKLSGGRMVWNEELKQEIPEGWEVKNLGEKLTFERGIEPGSKNYKSVKTENDIKFYRVSDMETDSVTFIDSKLAGDKTATETDVLVSFDGTVGRIGIGLQGAYSTGMRKIYDVEDDFNNALIYFIFKDERIQRIIKKYATGSNILHASGAIKHLMIPYDEDLYDLFKSKTTSLFEQILLNKKEAQELEQLRDYLLPLLMNGQVGFSDEDK